MSADLYRDKPKNLKKKFMASVGIPLSINHMYINTGRGGKKLNKDAERYVLNTVAYMKQCVEEQGWIKREDNTWYYLDLIVYMPDRRIRDSHNMLKLLLDTLEGILFSNDYYIMPRIIAVELDKLNPRVDFMLRPQTQTERKKILKEFYEEFKKVIIQ